MASLPPEQRNILRIMFLDPRARAVQYDWESVARFVVGAFRVDAARAGAAAEVEPLVNELSHLSPEFKAMWRENDVPGVHGEAVKHIRHPVLGRLAFEFSTFAVDGRTDLSMVVHNPATPEDAERIRSLIYRRTVPDSSVMATPMAAATSSAAESPRPLAMKPRIGGKTRKPA